MRQTFSGANRVWLFVLGILLLLAGLIGVLVVSGWLVILARQIGVGLTGPTPEDPVVQPGAASFLGMTAVVIGVLLVGVILGVLGLAWLLAQIPRVNAAQPFRLHDDATRGLTVVAPSILTDAVEQELQTLPGVSSAAAVLRGTAAQPELTIKVSADDRTDVPRLLHAIRTDVAAHLTQAMEAPLKRLAVQVDITNVRKTTSSATF